MRRERLRLVEDGAGILMLKNVETQATLNNTIAGHVFVFPQAADTDPSGFVMTWSAVLKNTIINRAVDEYLQSLLKGGL